MEKIGEDLQSDKLKSQTAIRCAKAAILLSSLKNATKNSITDLPQLQDDEMIGKLMFQLVKEKQKHKKLSQLIGISLIFLFIVRSSIPSSSFLSDVLLHENGCFAQVLHNLIASSRLIRSRKVYLRFIRRHRRLMFHFVEYFCNAFQHMPLLKRVL